MEQDPSVLLESVEAVIRDALVDDGVTITCCGLANQGETFLLYDRQDGQPLGPAVGWQDSRSRLLVERLAAEGAAAEIKQRTGLELHTQFPATKLPDLLRQEDARAALADGRLGFGTLDTWLIHRLCAERPHVTDPSTAARTMLYDLDGQRWDPWLCELFEVPPEILPSVSPSDQAFGTLRIDGHEVPLHASAVDTGAALFGQCCFDPGDAKNSFGTCSSLWVNVGSRSSRTPGVLDTVAWARGGDPTFAIDAEILAAGSLLTWLCERVGLARDPMALERLARDASDDDRVVCVPALNGLGAPHWDSGVAAAFFGMRAETTGAELARSAFDAIAYSLADAAAAASAAGHELRELRVDGGLTRSRFLMQRCADALGLPVVVAEGIEATAYGVGALAALAVGEVPSTDELRLAWNASDRFEPVWTEDQREHRLTVWRAAVAHARAADFARVAGAGAVA